MTFVGHRHNINTLCLWEWKREEWITCPHSPVPFWLWKVVFLLNMIQNMQFFKNRTFVRFLATSVCKLIPLHPWLIYIECCRIFYYLPDFSTRLKPYFHKHIFKTKSSFNAINVSHILTFQQNSQHDFTPPDLNGNKSRAAPSNLVALSDNKEILI